MLEFGGGDADFQVTEEDINIGISIKKGNTELKAAIDSVLGKMEICRDNDHICRDINGDNQ